MAQYKFAMSRMYNMGTNSAFDANINSSDISSPSGAHKSIQDQTPSFFKLLKDNDKTIFNIIVPIVWCFGFLIIMDTKSFVETLYMPFLGIFAAFLANCVPLGGGVVYIPAFYLLGVQLKLGVAFTVATMTVGNGIFGLIRWLKKDSTMIIWESFYYTVIPSSIGTLVAIFLLPTPSVVFVRRLFALFCFALAIFISLAVYRGGLNKVLSLQPEKAEVHPTTVEIKSIFDDITDDFELPPTNASSNRTSETVQSAQSAISSASIQIITPTAKEWLKVAAVQFLAGLVLVPNIGFGPALTTYLMLALVGYPVERAIVTGIITGGWVSIVPFIVHLFYFDDVPYKLWIMVIPGVFIGAKYAPYVHEYLGVNNVMGAFALFLFATALLFTLH